MILVAGSANLDFVVRAPHIPTAGETVLGTRFATYPGGKGANQAIACARAGAAKTAMLLALGVDVYAAPLEASLRGADVHMHIVRSADRATGTAFICVSDNAQNAITVVPGANHALTSTDLPALDGITHLLMQLEIPLPAVIAYARAARLHGAKVVLNAAPAQSLPPELLALLDILIVNEGELAAISGCDADVERGLQLIDVPCVIVTLGERGCVARRDESLLVQPGFPIQPVDTTAAGDTFCGVLTAELDRGENLADALRYACAAGALACLKPGAQSSIPTRDELEQFLRHNGQHG